MMTERRGPGSALLLVADNHSGDARDNSASSYVDQRSTSLGSTTQQISHIVQQVETERNINANN